MSVRTANMEKARSRIQPLMRQGAGLHSHGARWKAKEAVERMADDLDAARRALTDLALGVLCVKVQTSPGKYDTPTRQQAADLASDPVLLPALLAEDLARIYAVPPDVAALKLLMGYVMGGVPTRQEALLNAELEETHRKQAFLAEVLHEYVPEDAYPQVAARLRRIAAGGGGEGEE